MSSSASESGASPSKFTLLVLSMLWRTALRLLKKLERPPNMLHGGLSWFTSTAPAARRCPA